ILCANVQNAVCIDIKSDFDLWHDPWSRGDIGQVELAYRFVVPRQLALALQHMNFNSRLVVRSRGEDFRFARWNSRITLDQFGVNTSESLNTQRERGYVEQQYVFNFAFEH